MYILCLRVIRSANIFPIFQPVDLMEYLALLCCTVVAYREVLLIGLSAGPKPTSWSSVRPSARSCLCIRAIPSTSTSWERSGSRAVLKRRVWRCQGMKNWTWASNGHLLFVFGVWIVGKLCFLFNCLSWVTANGGEPDEARFVRFVLCAFFTCHLKHCNAEVLPASEEF